MVSAMIPILDSRVPIVRMRAAQYIGDNAGVDADVLKALPKLCDLALNDPDSNVRKEAVNAIAKFLECGKYDLDETVPDDDQAGRSFVPRDYIYRVLNDCLATDESPNVRSAAAWALGFSDEANIKDAVLRLIRALRDLDSSVRDAASFALGKIGDQSVLNTLVAIAMGGGSPDESAAVHAFNSMCEIIRRMSGQDS